MTNVTLNLSLPDELAERLAALPKDTVNNYAVQALADLLEADATDAQLDSDTIAAIEKGLADVDAGRTFLLEQVRARTDAVLDAHAAAATNRETIEA